MQNKVLVTMLKLVIEYPFGAVRETAERFFRYVVATPVEDRKAFFTYRESAVGWQLSLALARLIEIDDLPLAVWVEKLFVDHGFFAWYARMLARRYPCDGTARIPGASKVFDRFAPSLPSMADLFEGWLPYVADIPQQFALLHLEKRRVQYGDQLGLEPNKRRALVANLIEAFTLSDHAVRTIFESLPIRKLLRSVSVHVLANCFARLWERDQVALLLPLFSKEQWATLIPLTVAKINRTNTAAVKFRDTADLMTYWNEVADQIAGGPTRLDAMKRAAQAAVALVAPTAIVCLAPLHTKASKGKRSKKT
jgi:hypothetical protein